MTMSPHPPQVPAELANKSPQQPRSSSPSYPTENANAALQTFVQQSEPAQPASHTSSPSAPSSSSVASPESSSSASSSQVPPPETQPQPESSSAKRSRVQLAPNQPLTTHGKPRERVFVACVQCRTRKVRCDGAQPECYNCTRRADLNAGPCSYDSAPRRRGKDRTPGSRKLAPYIPKKTRTTRSRLEEEARLKKSSLTQPSGTLGPPPNEAGPSRTLERQPSSALQATNAPFDFDLDSLLLQPSDFLLSPDLSDPHSAICEEQGQDEEEITTITQAPSVQFTRETWWDALLSVYAAPLDRPGAVPTLTIDLRNSTSERVSADLRFLFQVSLHWFSFINIPRFFSTLYNPAVRQTLQPSLILGLLGLATFFQSSELELGAKGREKALRLIDHAHATFHASVNSGWIDVGLVQAAWILAVFEIQAHPKIGGSRTREAMAMLDSIIRCMSLTTLDLGDPRVTVFAPHTVPAVPMNAPGTGIGAACDPLANAVLPYTGSTHGPGPANAPTSAGARMNPSAGPNKWQCGCQTYSLGHHWPLVRELAPQWTMMPMWPKNVGEGEMQKEECRRLVWATVMLTATHNTKTTAGTDWEPQHLWIKDPSNYALLFPGENLASPGTPSIAASKHSVWALYMRTLLLWHSCLRMRCDMSMSDADRAQYAMNAWLEIDAIEAMLDQHSCTVETGFLVQVRDVLFNTRMCVSHEFQRYIPEATTAPGRLFYHAKAERWMMHLLGVSKFFAGRLRNPDMHGDDHSRRNFLMFWFMSQITRALALYNADHTLTIALDVARNFAVATEHLMLLWPTAGPRREYLMTRAVLERTCLAAGISPPEKVLAFENQVVPT
ncbi:hypothetical protein C8Q70DRAFT_1007912 [Cubamyces menziesii]|nr:hypothetical protein C8Q70DRAFT_1007912 [Cubamyces menziesii]